ncbi:MAG: hypothetical protein IPO92_06870 [Saprospiraceae bacterium]|nr:hypothetical protein [Saprospiraceae bacterium]
MIDMCKSDTGMCKMMMGKQWRCATWTKKNVNDDDFHERTPKGMKDMMDMGMCNMNGMDMDKVK